MILEYNTFIKQANNGYIIEVINDAQWKFILNELNNYKFYHHSNGKEQQIPTDYKEKLQDIETDVAEYIKTITPLLGRCVNKDNKKVKIISYEITPLVHWYEKFFRNYFENPKFTIPGKFEGINIIKKNIDDITEMVDVGAIRNNTRVLIKAIDKNKYSVVIIFEKINTTQFNINLQSQMRGEEYKDLKGIDIVKKYFP